MDDEEDRTPDEEPTAEETGAPEDSAPSEDAAPTEDAPAAEDSAPAEDAAPAEDDAEPVSEAPAPEAPEPVEASAVDAPAEDAAPAEEAAPAEDPTQDAPSEPPAAEAEDKAAATPKPRAKRDRRRDKEEEPEVIPGAHLEPDLVLEDPADRGDVGELAGAEIEAAEQALGEDGEGAEDTGEATPAPTPVRASVLDLAADARYRATGKRKRAVARVILKPGSGLYSVNGREMTAFFPRPTLQTIVRQPLRTVGHEERMDVIAKIHGGGVSAQAGALRHGISKALTEADPNLRGELKSRGFLTRDPRVKERKKAGLKKARKRPQFSKR